MARVARIALDLALSASRTIKPAAGTAWTYAKMEMAPPMTVNFLHGPTFRKVENAVSSAADGFIGALDSGIKRIDAFEAKRALEREAARIAAIEKEKADAEAKKKEEEERKKAEQEEIDRYKCTPTPEKGADPEADKKEAKSADTKKDVKDESSITKNAKTAPKSETKADGAKKDTKKMAKAETKPKPKKDGKESKPTSKTAGKKKEPARRKEPKTSRRETKKGSPPKPKK